MLENRETEGDVVSTVRKLLGYDDLSVISLQKMSRLYSTIWVVNVDRNGDREVFIAKHRPVNAERECYLSRRADQLFRDDPNYVCLDTCVDPVHSFIVSRRSQLPTLEDDLTKYKWLEPIGWFRRVESNVALAGKWLNHYHSFESKIGPISPGLVRFIENRESALKQLGPSTRDRLISAVNSCAEARLTITHCDFSPQNILTDGEKISVVDYGLSEWTQMSPYWDIATFMIDLKAHARFRLRSPLHWIPRLRSRLISSFLSGYGLSHVPNIREWHLCASVRYLSLFAGVIREDGPKATWYRRNLEKCLGQFDQCPNL